MSSYNDYELTIYPVNGRALPSVVNTVDKTITFNNLIRYDRANNRVLEFKNNAWAVIPNYFSSDYTGTKIYQNNLYGSAKADILNKEQFDLSKPWKYMMYGPSGDVSMVTSITLANNIYTFTSDIGKVDFDTQGNPITYSTLRFVVYKYDGFSQMTSSYLKYLYDVLKPESGCQVTRNGFKYVDFSSPNCKIDVASWLKIYIYGQSVGWQGGQQFVVDKIIKSIDDPGWDLLFYITDGNSQKGIAFKKDGTPLFTHYTGGSGSFGGISYDSYLIYRKDGFTNFTPTISTKIIPLDIMINPSVYCYLKSDPSISGGEINLTRKTITREITYQITNPIDKFQIVIPNDKPTNRIFVYQSGTNKLVHITNYIPKGTTQNVTIDYSQGVKSSVTPVYPLPVPNFYRYVTNVKAPYYGGDDDQGWNGGAICRNGQILESKGVQIGNNDSYMSGSCMTIYDNKIPVSSINNDGYQNITYYTDYNPNRFYNCEDGNNRGKIADIQFFGYEDCWGACVAGSRRWTTYRNTGIKIEQCAYPSIL